MVLSPGNNRAGAGMHVCLGSCSCLRKVCSQRAWGRPSCGNGVSLCALKQLSVLGWEQQTGNTCKFNPQRIPIRAVLRSHLMLYPPWWSHIARDNLGIGWQILKEQFLNVLKACSCIVERLFKSIKCQLKNTDHHQFIRPHAPPLPLHSGKWSDKKGNNSARTNYSSHSWLQDLTYKCVLPGERIHLDAHQLTQGRPEEIGSQV